MSVESRNRAPTRPMFVGREMICPRCKKYHDILTYKPMKQIDEYVHETVPIYVCAECNWKFAPAPAILSMIVTTAESYSQQDAP